MQINSYKEKQDDEEIYYNIYFLVFLILSFSNTSATEVSYEDNMKDIEGKYKISVQVNRWSNNPDFAGMDFPDTSKAYEVGIEL